MSVDFCYYGSYDNMFGRLRMVFHLPTQPLITKNQNTVIENKTKHFRWLGIVPVTQLSKGY